MRTAIRCLMPAAKSRAITSRKPPMKTSACRFRTSSDVPSITNGAGLLLTKPRTCCRRALPSFSSGPAKSSTSNPHVRVAPELLRRLYTERAAWILPRCAEGVGGSSTDHRTQLVALRYDLLVGVARVIAFCVVVPAHFIIGVAQHLVAVRPLLDMSDDVSDAVVDRFGCGGI